MSFAGSIARHTRLRQAARFQVEALERRVMLSSAIAAFGAQQTFAAGNKPDFVTTADVNRDGKPDVLVTSQSDNAVDVSLGNGNGTLQAPRPFATGSSPASLTVSDFNGDGNLDLAVANLGGNSVSVLLGNGNGTFQPQQTLSTGTGSNPYYIAAADVNGDGKADLVVSNFGTRTVGVFLRNGNGTFQSQQTLAAGLEPSGISIADVNGDGKPDLVVVNQGAGTVSLFLGNGNGTFQPRQVVVAGLTGNSVAVADLNGDGKPDLVTTQNNYSISVLLGNGNGTFAAPQTFAVNSVPTSLTLVDLNGDGKPDIATGDYRSAAVSVLLGNGNGTFQAARTFATGSSPFSVAACDLNRDGRPDLVVANQGSNYVGVLLGDVPPTVLSINRASPPGPNTVDSSVSYTVTFNEPVTVVGPTDFALATTGTVTATTPLAVSGGGAVYTVTISGISGAGTLGLTLVDDGSIRDSAGNPLQPGGTTSFQNYQTFASGPGSVAVAIADLNCDGKPDVVVANRATLLPHTVSVLLGNGDGTLSAPQTFVAGNTPVAVAVADINGDGKPDLVVVNSFDYDVGVLLGNGNGTFESQQTFSTGGRPSSVTVADLNGDGKPDLIVGDSGDNTICILLGNGNGTFGSQLIDSSVHVLGVAVGDLNGDGKPDVVAVGYPTGVPSGVAVLLLGNGNGTFQVRQTVAVGIQSPYSPVIADVNGDGRPDLVMVGNSTYVSTGTIGKISILLGNGNGTFSPRQTFQISKRFHLSIAVADVNGDARPDLLFVSGNYGQVNVLQGNGDGTFQAPQTFATAAHPYSVVAADINGDGRADLVVGVNGNLSVLLGSSGGDVAGPLYTVTLPADSLTGTSGNDIVTLKKDTDGTDIDWTMGTSSGQLPINDTHGLTINGNGGNDTITLDYTNSNPLPNTVHLNGAFTINNVQGTNPLANTTLEIAKSTVFISYNSSDPIAAIQSYLQAGYNNGAWNGTPTATTGVITSAAAQANQGYLIGYADSADGVIPGQPANTVELKYTLGGDLNLARTVNFANFALLVANYGKPASWDGGALTYGATVSFADFALLVSNYGKQAVTSASLAASAVNAPGVLSNSNGSGGGASSRMLPAIQSAGPAPVVHHPRPSKSAARKRR